MRARTACRTVAVCAAVLLAAACSSDPGVDTGPLGSGGTRGEICLVLQPGQAISWGITVLRNSGHSDAVIEKVSLVGARSLRLAASYVVPIIGNRDYGAWDGYPPAPPQHGVMWSQHTPAQSAHVKPMVDGHHANLVTVLKPTARLAKASAIDVSYREGGTQYELRTRYPIFIIVGQKECPGNWHQQFKQGGS